MRPVDADALFELFSSKYEEYGRLMEKQKVCSPISLTYGGMVEALFEALFDIRNAPTLDYAPKWISVKDRLPEAYDDGSVDASLVTNGYVIHMAYYARDTWFFCESGEMAEPMFYNVTHWMPLPEAPKEE